VEDESQIMTRLGWWKQLLGTCLVVTRLEFGVREGKGM